MTSSLSRKQKEGKQTAAKGERRSPFEQAEIVVHPFTIEKRTKEQSISSDILERASPEALGGGRGGSWASEC